MRTIVVTPPTNTGKVTTTYRAWWRGCTLPLTGEGKTIEEAVGQLVIMSSRQQVGYVRIEIES